MATVDIMLISDMQTAITIIPGEHFWDACKPVPQDRTDKHVQAAGVYVLCHMWTKMQWKKFANSCKLALMASAGMPSGPIALESDNFKRDL